MLFSRILRAAPSIAAAAAAALLSFPVPASATEFIPAGNYLETCTNIAYDPATQLLTATCQRKSGTTPRDTRLNVANCANRSIWNLNGDLYCFAAAPWGDERVVPKGSYIDSCSGFGVTGNVLSAVCWRGSSKLWTVGQGDQVATTLDLNGCDWAGDIGNDYGVLRCAPRGPVRLAPISPAPQVLTMVPVPAAKTEVPIEASNVPPQLGTLGVVPDKPPVPDTAAPDAPAEPDKKARRKKKHGDRGERG